MLTGSRVSMALLALFALSNVVIIGCSNDSALSPSADEAGGSSVDAALLDRVADHFSFFVTSIDAMRELSGNPNGFGGDLRFGQSDGLSGADEICRRSRRGHCRTTVRRGAHS
jgi:hypothetical protein